MRDASTLTNWKPAATTEPARKNPAVHGGTARERRWQKQKGNRLLLVMAALAASTVCVLAPSLAESREPETSQSERAPKVSESYSYDTRTISGEENYPRPWRQQLPDLDKVDAESRPATPTEPIKLDRSGPPPEPEVAFEDWRESKAKAVIKPPPPPPRPVQSAPANASGVTADHHAYTVQLGVFSSLDNARKFVEQNGLSYPDTSVDVQKKYDNVWYVVTFGRFPDRHSAEKRWQEVEPESRKLNVLIRLIRR